MEQVPGSRAKEGTSANSKIGLFMISAAGALFLYISSLMFCLVTICAKYMNTAIYSMHLVLFYVSFLCSLTPTFLSLFMGDDSESDEYEDSDSESEDPFTSHQARRQTALGSQRGAMTPFYNYPGAGWTPPFSSAPPLP